jgi:hypothetical protein
VKLSMKKSRAKSGIVAILLIFIALTFAYAIPELRSLIPERVREKLNDGIEIVKAKSIEIAQNLRLEEIMAAGFKVTETSLEGFMQICDRLKAEFGPITVYADVGARVMFVYADPSNKNVDKEVNYVQFSD